MDTHGFICAERAVNKRGQVISTGPTYKRSSSLNSVQIDVPVKDMVSWVSQVEVQSGYLTFCHDSEDQAIKTSRTFGAKFTAYTLEKVNNGEDGDSFAHQENFYPLLYKMLNQKEDWGNRLFLRGRASFELGVMEWTESILDKFKGKLDQAGIYGAVGVSRFPYHICNNTLKAFCELWSPLTNTLHHGTGEMSISLCDLIIVGGLPILGVPYEEFIPMNQELQRTTSSTLAELLFIHSELCVSFGKNFVFWEQWLAHFYRGRLLYVAFGESSSHVDRMQHDKFITRKLTPEISKEVELAAFLAFWLSRFVLPSHRSQIRPETFYMACLMAKGNRVSLAPAVLGHIYHGLGEIVTDPRAPKESRGCLPVHYVIGWLGEHFNCFYRRRAASDFPTDYPLLARYAGIDGESLDITSARIAFRTDASADYRPTPFMEQNGRFYLDNKTLSEKKFEFLLCIRSALLPVRMGDDLWLEPYYPNRFARQFGFDQGVPSNNLLFSVEKRRQCCIEDLARAQRTLLRAATGSRFYIARSTYHGTCTWRYCRWWMRAWRYCRWWMRACAPYLGRSVSNVYLTLKKQPLGKKNHVFVIKSLRNTSPNLRKEVLCPDAERENPPSRFGVPSTVRNVKRKRKDTRATLDSPRQRVLEQANDKVHVEFGDVTDDNVGSLPEEHVSCNIDEVVVSEKTTELRDSEPEQSPNSNPTKKNSFSGANSDSHSRATDLVDLDSGASPDSHEEAIPMSIHQIFGPEVKESRRDFILSEMREVLGRLSTAKSPQEVIANQKDIEATINLLTPMIEAIGTGKIEFNWFTNTINQIFKLAPQLAQKMDSLEESIDVDLLKDLSRQQEKCEATKRRLEMQLSSKKEELADLVSTECSIIEAERQATEAVVRAKLLRNSFETARKSLEGKVNNLMKSSEQQDKLEGELRQKRIEAHGDKLQEFEQVKATLKSEQKQYAKLINSLKSFDDQPS